MTLRRRIALVGAAAVLVAVVLACAAAYIVVRSELLGQIDDQLRTQGRAFEQLSRVTRPPPQRPRPMLDRDAQLSPRQGGPLAYVQLIERGGALRDASPRMRGFTLPIDDVDRAVAAGRRSTTLRDVTVDGVHVRLLTVGLDDGGAVQLGRPLDSTERVLSRLRWILLVVVLGGVGLAAVLSRFATRRVTAPLRGLADTADHIAETDDLGRRIAVTSDDELGQLARRFNSMLDGLEASRDELEGSVQAQRQLVADASHELRTPITSLRTNLEVLVGDDQLDAESREHLTADLLAQTEELGELVRDVIDLARGDAAPVAMEDVRLDDLVEEVVTVARRHHPAVAFALDTRPVVMDGAPERLARAVSNLLENAAKHSPPGGVVEVTVTTTGVSVRDHGPGVADEDLPHLFDRFYRGATSRRLPGTGLGLAIVRQVAEGHGGTVDVANEPGGGARFTLSLSIRPLSEPVHV